MSYLPRIKTAQNDAEQLENLYQDAVKAGDDGIFAEAITATFAENPDNLLYAAWFHRLAHVAAKAKGFAIAWAWVIPLAILNGLLFWWLSDDQQFMIQMTNYADNRTYDFVPAILLLAAPISAAFIMLYLTAAGRKWWGGLAAAGWGLAALTTYVLFVYPQAGPRVFQEQYLTLMAIHLPLLAWAAVGIYVLAGKGDAENRFAFLIKSLEVFIMAGLFVIAGGLFTGVTIGLFAALDIQFDTLVQRLFIAGGGGLIPVLAVALIYNPTISSAQQSFDEGLSKLMAMLLRLLLPLSLLVLLVYVGFIPFNFREPFENRDVLIIYNGMLFAIMALLVGATPVYGKDVSARVGTWLRRGIIAVAGLAVIISLYALSAILYRTWQGQLTPNRLVFIGWNIVNIGILLFLLFKQLIQKQDSWLARLHDAFAAGTVVYVIWVVSVILATPWLFGLDQGEIEALPEAVQEIVYEETYPILLKCTRSPHIYLLEDGSKRWVKDIPAFNAEGFEWRDVETISCDDLRALPDGLPIPPDAGEPPQP